MSHILNICLQFWKPASFFNIDIDNINFFNIENLFSTFKAYALWFKYNLVICLGYIFSPIFINFDPHEAYLHKRGKIFARTPMVKFVLLFQKKVPYDIIPVELVPFPVKHLAFSHFMASKCFLHWRVLFYKNFIVLSVFIDKIFFRIVLRWPGNNGPCLKLFAYGIKHLNISQNF